MRIISALLIVALFSMTACRFLGGEVVDGNGALRTEQRNITGFDGVSVSGSMDVVLLQDGQHGVRVEADENLLPYIETELDGGTLEIQARKGYNLRSNASIKVFVTAPYFNEVNVSGSGSVVSQTRVRAQDKLDADVSGSGHVRLEVDAPEVDLDISGSGTVAMGGNTRRLRADISGSGELQAFNLLSEQTEVAIAGSGGAEVFASKVLGVSISGSGNVEYKGNPPSLNQNVSGSGSVRKVQ